MFIVDHLLKTIYLNHRILVSDHS